MVLLKVTHNPDAIRVIANHRTIFTKSQCVDGFGTGCVVGKLIRQFPRFLLIGHGDVAAFAACHEEHHHILREFFRLGTDRAVFDRAAGLLTKQGVDARGFAVGNRVAEHGVIISLGSLVHVQKNLWIQVG